VKNSSLLKQLSNFFKNYNKGFSFLKKLIFINFISTLFDVISVVAIIPLITALLSKSGSTYIFIEKTFYLFFGVVDDFKILIGTLFFYLIIIFFATIIRLFVLHRSQYLISQLSSDISYLLFSKTLNNTYEELSSKHSSEIIGNTTLRVSVFTGYINSLSIVISSIITSIALIFTLLFVLPLYVFPFLGLIILIYVYINKKLKNRVVENSKEVHQLQNNMITTVQNSIGSIRDVIISNRFKYYTDIFNFNTSKFNFIQSKNHFYGHSPKIILEFLGSLIIVILMALLLFRGDEKTVIISSIAIIVVSFQRLLPSMQSAYQHTSNMLSSFHTMNDLIEILGCKDKQNIITNPIRLDFKSKIEIFNLNFQYKGDDKMVLKDVNLEFRKGLKFGIIGKTGSGKSTLMDILMGLLHPTSGTIYVDDILLNENNINSWQKNISFVPQKIFLFDGTIVENIAFGHDIKDVNQEYIIEILRKVDLYDFIMTKKEGLNFVIGEDGYRLSGGQRQRIAIARALFSGSKVLIFDEATSALDKATEDDIVDMLSNLPSDYTQFYITHRNSTLKNCDLILNVVEGNVSIIDDY
jgi:ABC-type multidrug transport system fused ATPase/permease subunit